MPGKLSFRARLQEQLDVATAAMAAAGTALTIQRQWNCIDLAHTVQFRCKCDNKWSDNTLLGLPCLLSKVCLQCG